MKDKSTIFIITGMPRSGTKLLVHLLNNNEKIAIPQSEMHFWPDLIRRYLGPPDLVYNRRAHVNIIEYINRTSFVRYMGKRVKVNFDSNTWTNNDLFVNIISQYSEKKEPIVFGDKTPSYIFCLDIFVQTFEDIKIVHIARDPRDVALSSMKIWGKNIYRIAYQYKMILSKLKSWEDKNILNEFNFKQIRYEDLLGSPVETLRDLCGFLGVSYCDDMLNVGNNVENYGDAKDASVILSNNKNKYMSVLTDNQIRSMEEICYDWLGNYGYPIHYASKSVSISRMRLSICYLMDAVNIMKFRIKDEGMSGMWTQWILFRERMGQRFAEFVVRKKC